MVMVKILDNQGMWHWFANVESISHLQLNELDDDHKIIGRYSESEEPHCLALETATSLVHLVVYGQKAYMCSTETGSTIDTLF